MILAIVQARSNSSRFPGKVLKKILGRTIIEIVFKRLSYSKQINKIVLATSINNKDIKLKEIINKLGYDTFSGSEDNVLDRFYQIAKKFKTKGILRITGDCPLIDYEIVDSVVEKYISNKVDYVSNINPPSFPDGLDVEIFSFESLKSAWENANSNYEKEHVTPYIVNNDKFKKINIPYHYSLSDFRLTLDEKEDFEVIKNVYQNFKPDIYFKLEDILKLKKQKPDLFEPNKMYKRNSGNKELKGLKLWNRAKKIIPGGNMLLSKRPEMFLPNVWPPYFLKAKGCKIIDLDGRKYIDMSYMGIGTNILGYGNEEVDEAVKKSILDGNLSTLNCPEEVYLAEKLIQIHPWAHMVKFARTGGEANSIAIRIARASTGKDQIAICGYHGWHDWYLAANVDNKKNLEHHLSPNLKVDGVPKLLKNTIFQFQYNDIDKLLEIVDSNNIGIIKMEVYRNIKPKNNFLHKVRELANKKNIVLIFDECTSGFRETNGGLHKKYEIEPDMAIFGKALGNGYAITAILGKRKIMESVNNTFISSTFWTERLGNSAALKTLEIMEKIKSWKIITSIGKNISNIWKLKAKKYEIPITIMGLPSLTNFVINSDNWMKYKAFITQEFLKKGYLASNAVYVSTCHNDKIIYEYATILDNIFKEIQECENGKPVKDLIDTNVSEKSILRMN